VVAARQHRPTEIPAAGEAVDPGDGVAIVVIAFEHASHAVVDVVGALRVAHDVRGLDRLELQPGVGDDTGETHAAARRPERVGVGVGMERGGTVRGRDHAHLLDEVGERTVPELAVDVGGDGPADGDVAGAGDDHREPTER
jgi:hypothetical protein